MLEPKFLEFFLWIPILFLIHLDFLSISLNIIESGIFSKINHMKAVNPSFWTLYRYSCNRILFKFYLGKLLRVHFSLDKKVLKWFNKLDINLSSLKLKYSYWLFFFRSLLDKNKCVMNSLTLLFHIFLYLRSAYRLPPTYLPT